MDISTKDKTTKALRIGKGTVKVSLFDVVVCLEKPREWMIASTQMIRNSAGEQCAKLTYKINNLQVHVQEAIRIHDGRENSI